jgi:glutamate synthase domain-containing protein 2
MKRKIRSIIEGLQNLWKWRKVIYKDRNYDHWFIYEILKTKLKFQAEYMQKHGITESSSEVAAQIFECVDLIDKVQNEYYIDEALNIEDKNWSDDKFNEAIKKDEEAREQLFLKLKNQLSQWWD